ncbi:MAG: hypothetical protein ACKVWV_03465 [Planctomycetota bacterium]
MNRIRLAVRGTLAAALFAQLVAGAARAQSIYIDFGVGSPPSSSYAAAAGTPGEWNEMPMPSSAVPLVGLAGEATSATWAAFNCDTNAGTDFPNTTGDDEALLDDWIYADCAFDLPRMDIVGLVPGEYLMFAYPKADGGGFVNVNTVLLPQGVGAGVQLPQQAPFAGNFGTWLIAVIPLSITPGTTLRIRPGSDVNQGLSGIQLVRIGDASRSSAPFCFGDGTGAICPCNNTGTVGRGCGNAAYANGALLGATGIASVSADSLTLTATSMSGFQSWYFQSTDPTALPFGRGIQCLAGTLIRVGQKNVIGGSSANPSGVDLPLSIKGGIPPAGATRYYQVAYRQVAPACVPAPISNTNRTNGVTVIWSP